MRAIVQRVLESFVSIDGRIVGKISKGFNVLIGICNEDTDADVSYIAKKIINLRIFDDEEGKMNKSLKDVDGEILVISQFTLYGDARKGNRPSFINAKSGNEAKVLYEKLIYLLKKEIEVVETGEFGAEMEVCIINDGPVTILLDSKKLF
ncbi:MAG: D-aminoacyl-tRNA deacylase [Oscillospiraceae bacterium]|nr:D-aminoacyl-tRNA deacylase [Oscillospiraceae bacterium]